MINLTLVKESYAAMPDWQLEEVAKKDSAKLTKCTEMNIDGFFYLDKVRSIAFKLPAVTEGTCYGTPGFYAGKKLFARLREEGDILVIYTEEREVWFKKDPKTFFITDHYINSLYMLVNLARVSPAHLSELLKTAWSKRIGKKILAEWGKNTGK